MDNNNKSFRLDRQARSFHVSDFTFRDLPLMAVVFAVLTVIGLALSWFLKFLPLPVLWLLTGFGVGFYLGLVFSSWRQRSIARKGLPAQPVPSFN
jgi:hypothetical protein